MLFFFVCFFKQKTAYEMRISDWSSGRVLFRSGLHNRLADVPVLKAAAARHDRKLFDVRHPTREFAVASGKKRPGKRLLAVGTDCSVGKMYTTLALEKAMQAHGLKADLRATGQTGIPIARPGVPTTPTTHEPRRGQ